MPEAAPTRRNFVLGVINGALVNFGLAFIDPFTVLPVFVTRLGASDAIVGLATATYAAGWFAPQLFVAPIVEARRRVLGIYVGMAFVRVAAYAALAAVVFYMPIDRVGWFLLAAMGCFAVSTVAAGISGVPFLEVTSKAFPVTTRGNFFGMRRFIGGALGILAGVVVAVVIGAESNAVWTRGPVFSAARSLCDAVGATGQPFPRNYGILFVLGGIFAALGYAAFAFVKEPDGVPVTRRRPVREIIVAGMALLRAYKNYRLFLLVRVCWQFTAMAFPFYATFAVKRLGFSDASVGAFVSLWVGSAVVSNYIWGRLGDARGNRLVLLATAIMSIVPPVAMLWIVGWQFAPGEASSLPAFILLCATYVINGCARSGRFIANMTYLLEAVPQEGRPIYVGFMNTLSFPFMLSPVVGGLIVTVFSFRALFIAATLAALANIVLSARIGEPRARSADDTVVNMP